LPGYLLVYLAHRGDWITREALATTFWPERTEEAALHNLRANLHRVRRLLAEWDQDASLLTEVRRVRLDLPTDVAAFLGARARKDWVTAAEARGDAFLATLSFRGLPSAEEWAVEERRVLAGLWRDAALKAAQCCERAGDAAKATDLLLRLANAEALTEEAARDLLRVAAITGRRAEAVEACERFRAWMTSQATPPVDLKNGEHWPPAADPADGTRSVTASARGDDGGSFVGRRTELAELVGLLQQPDCRLISILGLGGVGKSSLARRLLAQAGRIFPGGAVWVDLQDLGGMPAALARMADQLGATINDTRDPVAQIARRLKGGKTLIVLDNAEHLSGIAEVADRLLDASPEATLVLTSRVRTQSRQERPFPLGGLVVPDEESRDFEAAASFDAVRMFAQRAARSNKGFDLAGHLPAVIQIVEAVDGLPLAIELAAGWTRLLPPEEIARSLHVSTDLLARDPAAPGSSGRAEHASLNDVLERSWQMLTPREQQAMVALSVFRGGFKPSAAQAIADVSLSLLSALVDKSFLSVDAAGRFSVHPLVAAYSSAIAQNPAALEALQRRHADYFARFVADFTAQARLDPRDLTAAVSAEFANCVAAWRFALAQRDCELIAAMAPAWGIYFDTQGRYSEGEAELHPALDLPEAGDALPALAKVRAALAVLLLRKRDLQLALTIAKAGVEIAERCGDRRSQFSCLMHAGACLSILGQWQQAQQLFERALAIAQDDGMRPELGAALLNLGICRKKEGRFDEALRLYTRALAIEQELRRHGAVAKCLYSIAVLRQNRNEWAHARELMEQGLRHCERFGVATQIPYFEAGLGTCEFELGRIEEAERHQRRALEHARQVEERGLELHLSTMLARTWGRLRRFDDARDGFRSAARIATRIDSTPDLLHIAMYYAEVLRDSGQRVEAARLWRMVSEHPRAEAGDRNSALMWLDGLRLSGEETAAGGRAPVTLASFIAALLDADLPAAGPVPRT
jgi:predicted ATPase/DNA-binding SARP family transcriptional activator/Tfp pilus assembly protein PilF